ncbi:hypothetical protein HOY80DRAFT_1024863 [Tuber brumale]|nr:hypothetical protein HOY80DRAFT_1024863 [Tuber brumale]
MSALIACGVEVDEDQRHERQSAVNALEKAAKEVKRENFESWASPKFVYANSAGASTLRSITVEVEGLKEELKKLQECQQSLNAEWGLTIRPLKEIAIAIRCRFFSNFRESIGMPVLDDPSAIVDGIIAVHQGDLETDAVLMARGHIRDIEIFSCLYGISYEDAQSYLKSETVVKMINKRATMLANAGRWSNLKLWDRELQVAFEKLLSYFANASAKEWIAFEADLVGQVSEKRDWLSIVFA